ncbi:hypothetical protein ACFQS1_40190 [Paractinoplanes rhizophilus]|uniref:Uncharacterized protein n=1 Tax=Paractinoplanes rhizophilus TaxID=1416877 RepID=A0ABW2I5T2_9ACTN
MASWPKSTSIPRSCRPVWTACVNSGVPSAIAPVSALAGREAVFLRRPWDEADETEPQIYCEHLGPDGRRLRQVEIYADSTAVRTRPEHWPFNPPNDLYDPDLVQWEIGAQYFGSSKLSGVR